MRSAEIAVIGGGIIGGAVAYELGRRGRDVVLLERDKGIGGGASGACDGFLSLQSKRTDDQIRLAQRSLAIYEDLADELGRDLELDHTGGLVLIEEDVGAGPGAYPTTAEQNAGERASHLANLGLRIEYLDGAAIRKRLPGLSETVKGGILCPDEAQVDPLAVTAAYVDAAAMQGVRVQRGCGICGACCAGGRVLSIETDDGALAIEHVIICAGAWSGEVAALFDVRLPVRPRRGQLLVTQPAAPLLGHWILGGDYLKHKRVGRPEVKGPPAAPSQSETEAVRAGQTEWEDALVSLSLEQTRAGDILIGSSREFAGFDRRTTPQVCQQLLANAVELVPVLKDLLIIRSFAGLRPWTPDGAPILGRAVELENLYFACGHEGDGIALAPITGRLMAQLLCGEEPEVSLEPFSPARFSQ